MRNAIWDAAIDLFAEMGFDETTVDDIAAATGVSQRTFFRYYASKADLLSQGTLSLGIALHQTITTSPPDHTAVEVMRQAVLSVAKLAAEYPRTEKIRLLGIKYPAARMAQMSPLAEVQSKVEQAYACRTRDSKKDRISPRLLAALTTSIFEVVLTTWLERGKPDIESVVDEVFGAARQLLTPPSR